MAKKITTHSKFYKYGFTFSLIKETNKTWGHTTRWFSSVAEANADASVEVGTALDRWMSIGELDIPELSKARGIIGPTRPWGKTGGSIPFRALFMYLKPCPEPRSNN